MKTDAAWVKDRLQRIAKCTDEQKLKYSVNTRGNKDLWMVFHWIGTVAKASLARLKGEAADADARKRRHK